MDNKIDLYVPEMVGQGMYNWFVRSREMYFNPNTNEMEYMFLTVEGTVEFDNPIGDLKYYYFKGEPAAFEKRKEYLTGCKPTEIDPIGSQPLFED